MTKADRDRARIAELRRLARLAHGREQDPTERRDSSTVRWEPDTGVRLVSLGPGMAGLLPEEAAKRMKWAPGKMKA